MHNKKEYSSQPFEYRKNKTRSNDSQNPHGQILIGSRESHTADLDSYDRYIQQMKKQVRHANDNPFNAELWKHIRSVLETHGQPLRPQSTSNEVDCWSVSDSDLFLEKIIRSDQYSYWWHPDGIVLFNCGGTYNSQFCFHLWSLRRTHLVNNLSWKVWWPQKWDSYMSNVQLSKQSYISRRNCCYVLLPAFGTIHSSKEL